MNNKKSFAESLEFVKPYTDIDNDTTSIILHCRKSVLFDSKGTWTKKDGNLFDVTMGSYDGVEICELVGLYLLNALFQIIKNTEVGLYRDDGLAVVRNLSGPQIKRQKKKIIKVFKENDQKINNRSWHHANRLLRCHIRPHFGIFPAIPQTKLQPAIYPHQFETPTQH